MSLAPEFKLYQVTADVQYERGVVYLDHCGSLTLKLLDQLGEPFKPGQLAGMEYGDVNSVAERIVVRYGRASTMVTQSWPATSSPVRVEQLAPIAWDVVVGKLDVGRSVTRCAVRFWLVWSVDSIDEAHERIRRSKLFMPSEEWISIFGEAGPSSWSAVIAEAHANVRVGIDYGQSNVQGPLPVDLTGIIPKHSILLDFDHYRPARTDGPTFSLTRADLKELIRTSWQRTKTAATQIGKLLGG